MGSRKVGASLAKAGGGYLGKKAGQAVDATAAATAKAAKKVAGEVLKRNTQAKMAQQEFGIHQFEL